MAVELHRPYGDPTRRQRIDVDDIITRYNGGESVKEIIKATGLNQDIVGITLRLADDRRLDAMGLRPYEIKPTGTHLDRLVQIGVLIKDEAGQYADAPVDNGQAVEPEPVRHGMPGIVDGKPNWGASPGTIYVAPYDTPMPAIPINEMVANHIFSRMVDINHEFQVVQFEAEIEALKAVPAVVPQSVDELEDLPF